jgi:hypothetical protein
MKATPEIIAQCNFGRHIKGDDKAVDSALLISTPRAGSGFVATRFLFVLGLELAIGLLHACSIKPENRPKLRPISERLWWHHIPYSNEGGTFPAFYYKLAVIVRYIIAIGFAGLFTLAGCARLNAIRDCQVEYPLPAPGYAVLEAGPAGSAFLYVPGNSVVLNPGETVEDRSAAQYACIAQAQKAHPVFQ